MDLANTCVFCHQHATYNTFYGSGHSYTWIICWKCKDILDTYLRQFVEGYLQDIALEMTARAHFMKQFERE